MLRRCDVDVRVAVTVLLWLPLILELDRGATLSTQWSLGAATWLLLLVLALEAPLVRAQIAVVVVLATAVECVFSPLLHVYVYRLGNVPAFVPPGHGLVYLAALCLGRCGFVRVRKQLFLTATSSSEARIPDGHCCSPAVPTCSARSGSRACSGSCAGAAHPCCTWVLCGRDLSRTGRYPPGHRAMERVRSHWSGEHREPTERSCGRLRLV
jgi:hypothetical protein